MARAAAVKFSVSVPAALARQVRRRAGVRGLSGYVARALQHEIEREQLGAYLTELDALHGPVDAGVLDEVRAAWPKR